MALSSFVGNFAINTGAGNQVISGIGFTPKIVLFYPTIQTSDGVVVDAYMNVGVGVSSSSRRALTSTAEDGQGTSDSQAETTSSSCILVNNVGASSTLYAADLVTLDADGFTINVTTPPGSGFRVGFWALGGDDLTDVFAGTFSAATSDGNQSVAGVGFQPDGMIQFGNTLVGEGSNNNGRFTFGGAVSSTKRFVIAGYDDNGLATTNTKRLGSNSACYYEFSAAGVERAAADFVSFDADGFTWDWINAPGGADTIYFVCFKGGQYDVGEIQSQTSTGEFPTTGVGFQPTGGMWSSAHVADELQNDGMELSIGIASSSTEQFALSDNNEDAQGTSDCDSQSDDDRIYLNYDYNQTKEGDIKFVSYGADGFTLDQTDADPSQFDIYFFVVGSDAVPPEAPGTIGFITAPTETSSKPSYEIWLTDDFGTRIGKSPLTTFKTFEASRVVNQPGFFNITMPLSFDVNLIQPDRMVQFWRAPRGGRLALWRVYFIRKWRFASQGADQIVSFGGPDVLDLLRRRIVAAFTGSAEANQTDFADDMMKEVVTQAIADGVEPVPTEGTRVWGDLSIASDLGLGPTITKSFPFEKLMTSSGQGTIPLLAKAAREAGTEVFFDIVPNVITSSSASFQFQTFTGQPGQDHTSRVVFEERKNMVNPSLEYDYTEEENYIYATGKGEEADREVVQVSDSERYSISQWGRIEGQADSRNQTGDGVREAGRDKLNDGRPRIRFSATPIDISGTRFGRDWDFGDQVKAKFRNIEFDTIIRAVTISVDENGKETIGARLDFEN